MRKVSDCRDHATATGCTLTISGEEDDVVRAAAEHAVSAHDQKDTLELRQRIRESLKIEQVPLHA